MKFGLFKFFAVTLCCAVLLCSCGGPGEPSPSVSIGATPEPSRTYLDAYQQAEQIYLRIDEINNTHIYAGKYEPFPAELETLAMDPYLSQLKDAYQKAAHDKLILVGADKAKFEIRKYHDDIDAGAAIVLRSCSDYRETKVIRDGQETGNAALRYERWYFKFDDQMKLKLFGIKSEEVAECTLESGL